MTDQPHCAGTRVNGEPCRSTLGIGPTGFCLAHDPGRREQMIAARAAGGRARTGAKRAQLADGPLDVPPAPKTLDDAVAFASWLTHAVVVGKIDARTAHESGYCLVQFTSAAKQRDLERKVKDLLRQIDAMKKAAGRVS